MSRSGLERAFYGVAQTRNRRKWRIRLTGGLGWEAFKSSS